MPHTTRNTLIGLALAALASIALFLCWDIQGNLGFVIPFRLRKIAMMCLVAYAVGASTILFQTISANRILTPGIMGYDALFLMLKTLMFAVLGSATMGSMPTGMVFILNMAVMTALSCLLYQRLFRGHSQSLHLMILTGVVLSSLFRSATNFLQSLIDPNTFLILQNSLFANFNNPDSATLAIAAIVIGLAGCGAYLCRHELDVLALGRETAISLGVPYRAAATRALILVAVMISVSTSLVGPVTFFGLLAAHLAYRLLPTHRHSVLIPATALVSITILLLGQAVLEHWLGFATVLSVIIEFGGGILFLALLLKGAAR